MPTSQNSRKLTQAAPFSRRVGRRAGDEGHARRATPNHPEPPKSPQKPPSLAPSVQALSSVTGVFRAKALLSAARSPRKLRRHAHAERMNAPNRLANALNALERVSNAKALFSGGHPNRSKAATNVQVKAFPENAASTALPSLKELAAPAGSPWRNAHSSSVSVAPCRPFFAGISFATSRSVSITPLLTASRAARMALKIARALERP